MIVAHILNLTTKRNIIVLSAVALLFSLTNFVYAQYDSIPHEGYYRSFLIHLPSTYSENIYFPLIIALHGGFGNAYQMENNSQLSIKADAENFIVVYPEGLEGGILGIRTWNAGWCCGYSSGNNIDDVGFIDKLIDTLVAKYSIDVNRIYATGMSNGGFMSYRLACELSDRIAAIAPVPASMSMTYCNPNRPVPIISFHSYLDTNVPINGGLGDGLSDHYNPSQDSVISAWAIMNNCSGSDTVVNNAEYTEIKKGDCDCAIEMRQFISQDGGHSWPGGNTTPIGDPVSVYIDANDLMWDFFKHYTLDCDTTSASTLYDQKRIVRISPNPASNLLNIQTSLEWNKILVSVFNMQGQEILSIRDQTKIDISKLPPGLMFVRVEIDSYILKAEKIIKLP